MQELWQLEMEYLDRRRDGMDISDIRKELQQKDVSDENIALIIGAIDDAIYKELVPERNREPGTHTQWRKIIGWSVIIGGVVLALVFGIYVLGLSSILVGLGMIKTNRGDHQRLRRKFE